MEWPSSQLPAGFKSCGALIHAYALAPKALEPKKLPKKAKPLAFDYSKWDSLEREMLADEEEEQNTRTREANMAVRRLPASLWYGSLLPYCKR